MTIVAGDTKVVPRGAADGLFINTSGACELLGLDPLHVANEGTIVATVDPRFAEIAATALRHVPGCEQATIIGEVQSRGISPVTIRRTFGSPQPLDEPSGAPLPRIC